MDAATCWCGFAALTLPCTSGQDGHGGAVWRHIVAQQATFGLVESSEESCRDGT